ncbi:MAG: EAL domain-containing protein [Ilumatobacter sp.]|uniref:sensor domain-containing phosphodiesterase n=1 Tax=Ilumatobacter sp. TaxID=1967498 RepID=UPI003C76DD9F
MTDTTSSQPTPVDVEALLNIVRRQLGMDLAWMSSFEDGQQIFDAMAGESERFGLAVGDSGDLQESFCLRVLDGRLPNMVPDTIAHPTTAALDITDALGIGAYIGVPVHDGRDAPFGMLCCISQSTADHLVDADVRTMEVFAAVLGELLTNDETAATAIRRNNQIRTEITSDIDKNRLRMVFQPIIDPIDEVILGVEALCRVDGSHRRPDEWFADAASVGLGVEAEIAAIDAALTQLPDLPEPLYMSLNASPTTIADHRLSDTLARSSPTRLVIEITEHSQIDDYPAFVADLDRLRSSGIRIAVDDVGAGFSSFSHVLELQPDVIKLDRFIVAGIDEDPSRQAIASAVVDLGRRVGSTVVAEGVETMSELSTTVTIGIGATQGYLLCRPTSLHEALSSASAATGITRLVGGTTLDLTFSQMADRFELAMYHSPAGVALVGLDGSFRSVNPALQVILQRNADELMSTNFQALTHPDDLELDLSLLEDCLAGTSDSYQTEKRYLLPGGDVVATRLSVVLVRSKLERPLYFISQILPVDTTR